mmetsp:Transcript_65341/g.103525  ORF Transcript_65341/g.103525 Transcript_65341/m.103525 type:complete len:241 (+) Transcript_65341:67-789(+)
MLSPPQTGHETWDIPPKNLAVKFDAVAGQGDSPLRRRRSATTLSRPQGASVVTPPPRRGMSLWHQLTPEDPPSDHHSQESSASTATRASRPKRSIGSATLAANAPVKGQASKAVRKRQRSKASDDCLGVVPPKAAKAACGEDSSARRGAVATVPAGASKDQGLKKRPASVVAALPSETNARGRGRAASKPPASAGSKVAASKPSLKKAVAAKQAAEARGRGRGRGRGRPRGDFERGMNLD